MVTGIILIILIIIGIFLIIIDTDISCIVGVLLLILSGACLIVHVILISLSSYDYSLFIEKRNAFQQTLYHARENGNEYEIAAIVKEIANWNENLAEYKFNNKFFFFDPYIDDRIEELKPIK